MACGKMTFEIILVIFCAFISVNASNHVIVLNEDNWNLMLNNEWMVEFYAPWCPVCKGLQPTWKDFATWSDELQISVARVDVTNSPGLSGRFMVTALPTIFHVINGEFRQYKGARDKEAFMSFIEEKEWKAVDPVPSWQSPNSIPMTVVSTFFKFSQVLRHFHNTLMEEYGLPSWGSYLIFSVGTILVGAILGMVLVCVIDLIYPQRFPKSDCAKGSEDGEKEKDSEDELTDKDVKDELADKDVKDELADKDIKDDLVDDASNSDQEVEKFSSSDTEQDKPATSKPNSPNIKKRRTVFSNF